MFEELSSLFTTDNDDETVPESIRTEIVQHLTALEDEFERYFPQINGDEESIAGTSSQPDFDTSTYRNENDGGLRQGRSSQTLSRPNQDACQCSGIFAQDSNRGEELLQLFQEATNLRKTSAELDERFAYLFGRLQ